MSCATHCVQYLADTINHFMMTFSRHQFNHDNCVIMKHEYFQTMLALLSTTTHREVHIVNQLNGFFGFEHNIFLLDSKSDHNHFIPMPSHDSIDKDKVSDDGNNFTTQTIYILDENSSLNEVTVASKSKLLIVVLANFSKFSNESTLLTQIQMMRQLDASIKIGVFLTRIIQSMETVEQLFRWSWTVRIVNIFCGFYSIGNDSTSSFNIFTYNPFGTFEMVNVTESESPQNYFPHKVPNYRQHPLVLVQTQILSTFYLEVQFWDTVVRLFNATKIVNNMSHKDAQDMGQKRVGGHGDFMLHEIYLQDQVTVYPHRMALLLILVPHSQPFPNFVAYLKNATWTRLFVYTFFVISLSSLSLIISGYLKQEKLPVAQRIADVINLLINDNGYIKYGDLNLADIFVIVPLTFTGLIVVNGVLSIFQSYLTVPIYERQIDSLEDLYRSRTQILTNEIFSDAIIELFENVTKFGEWNYKVSRTNSGQVREGLEAFNSSVAFLAMDHESQMYLKAQQRLDLKAYHLLAERSLGKWMLVFQPLEEFPFVERIEDITQRLQSAGLIDKWLNDGNQEAVESIVRRNRALKRNSFNASDSSEFHIPDAILLASFGWLVSLIVFACEIIWNKLWLHARLHVCATVTVEM